MSLCDFDGLVEQMAPRPLPNSQITPRMDISTFEVAVNGTSEMSARVKSTLCHISC